MTPDPNRIRIRGYITEFKFKPLFVEELGWDMTCAARRSR